MQSSTTLDRQQNEPIIEQVFTLGRNHTKSSRVILLKELLKFSQLMGDSENQLRGFEGALERVAIVSAKKIEK